MTLLLLLLLLLHPLPLFLHYCVHYPHYILADQCQCSSLLLLLLPAAALLLPGACRA
jgi:hypothetical protein